MLRDLKFEALYSFTINRCLKKCGATIHTLQFQLVYEFEELEF